MSTPLVSVLIPVFNAEQFVADAIGSIVNQTYRNIEVIVVNDGSIDRSGRILRCYAEKDSRIKLIERPNTGIVGALTDGLALAHGKYIARMDADDIAMPDRIKIQVEAFERDSCLVLLGGVALLTCERGLALKIGMYQRFGTSREHSVIVSELLSGFGAAVVHPAAMMRADAIRVVGGYREKYNLVEDLDLFLRLSEVGTICNLPDTILLYRQHLGSTNHTQRERQHQKCVECIREFYSCRRHQEDSPVDVQWAPLNATQILHDWAENALMDSSPAVALQYAVRAIRRKPISRTGWRLGVRALFGICIGTITGCQRTFA